MTEVLPVRLTAEQARDLTQAVRDDVRALWVKVLDLFEGGAHLALGYASWGAYWEGEFGQSSGRGEQLVRAGRVARALEAGTTDVPLPANDLLARELIPVLRQAPDDVGDVWARAYKTANGRPTAEHLRELVEPYRTEWEANRPHASESWNRRASTKRARNLAGVPLVRAHSHAEGAHANIGAAIDAGTTDGTLAEWLEHAEAGARLLSDVAERIRTHLANQRRDTEG